MTNNSIWITGAGGRLGHELVARLSKNSTNKVIGTDIDTDITNLSEVETAIEIYHPAVIINCASISDIEKCESDPVNAYRVNALGARNLASASRRHNARMIQMSTDDVFDGNRSGSISEFDDPSPVSVYGKSKLAGEKFVRELNPKHLIIRSSWLYGVGSGDFLSYVLGKAKNGEKFTVPSDRISTPTSASLLSELVLTLIDKGEYGIFHASCEGECSRHEFAQTILSLSGYDKELAEACISYDGRNYCTVLENLMLKMTGAFEMPEWKTELEKYIASKGDIGNG